MAGSERETEPEPPASFYLPLGNWPSSHLWSSEDVESVTGVGGCGEGKEVGARGEKREGNRGRG
jgi:hypothetical protein